MAIRPYDRAEDGDWPEISSLDMRPGIPPREKAIDPDDPRGKAYGYLVLGKFEPAVIVDRSPAAQAIADAEHAALLAAEAVEAAKTKQLTDLVAKAKTTSLSNDELSYAFVMNTKRLLGEAVASDTEMIAPSPGKGSIAALGTALAFAAAALAAVAAGTANAPSLDAGTQDASTYEVSP